MRLLALLSLLVAGVSCSHTPRSTGLEGLRPVAEEFHRLVRWKEYGLAARLVVPERREAFERARRERQDERDLNITDFELKGAELSEDGLRGTVRSRVQWYRLPSATEHTEPVTSEFVFVQGRWLLERQRGGPFDGDLP